MQGDYPHFKTTYLHEELVEHFLLNPAERALVDTCRGDGHRHGVAVLLKAVQYLGYFPYDLRRCRRSSARSSPISSNSCGITRQTIRGSRTHDGHLALIRQHTGFRFPTGQDKQALERWLRTYGAPDAPTEEELRECAYARLRALGIELPASKNSTGLSRQPSAASFRMSMTGWLSDSPPQSVPPWMRSSWWALRRHHPWLSGHARRVATRAGRSSDRGISTRWRAVLAQHHRP